MLSSARASVSGNSDRINSLAEISITLPDAGRGGINTRHGVLWLSTQATDQGIFSLRWPGAMMHAARGRLKLDSGSRKGDAYGALFD